MPPTGVRNSNKIPACVETPAYKQRTQAFQYAAEVGSIEVKGWMQVQVSADTH